MIAHDSHSPYNKDAQQQNGGGDDFLDYPETATFIAQQPTLHAERTQTAAPLRTWAAEVQQTLTALPANGTATGAAMGTTETRAAIATQQLFCAKSTNRRGDFDGNANCASARYEPHFQRE